MSNEQNLYEMMRSLQESVDNLSDSDAVLNDLDSENADISTEDLQKKLEERYFSDGASGKHESDGTYDLDSDFLAEFSEAIKDEVAVEDEGLRLRYLSPVATLELEEESSAEEVEEEAFEEDVVEEETVEEELFEEDVVEEETVEENDGEEAFEVLDDEADEIFDELLKEESNGEPLGELTQEELGDGLAEDIFEKAPNEEPRKEPEDEHLEEESEEQSGAEITEEAPEEEQKEESKEDPKKAEKEEKSAFDAYAASFEVKEKPKSFKALMMDYGKPDPIPSPKAIEEEKPEEVEEEDTPDVGDILSDFADDSPTEEDRINNSVRKLMTSLGCEDELENISAEDIGDIYGQFGGESEQKDESFSAEAVEKKRDDYKKGIVISALKLTACAIMTVFMFFYDLLPVFDVEFMGLTDYVLYPGAYVIIGTQLLLICAVCLWRPMWDGIKRLLTVYPNVYSMAVVMVCSNIVYDVVFFITGSYKPFDTPTFHFICGTVLTGIALYEFLMRIREASAFDLYSTTDVARFTLSYDKSKDSIGEKMYSGGFSKDKKVYSLSPVSSPKGFSEAVREDGALGNGIFMSLILLSVGVGVLLCIALMIAGHTLEEGAIAAMSAVMTLLPVTAVPAIALPLSLSGLRLKKRGIALTGREMIRKYGSEHAIVFNDLHLFKKCDPKRVGFVCYEKLQMKNVLAALNILYSRIGGPMGEIFANIPDDCMAKSIRIRRITRSGIEAVVDKSHTLVVGDVEFLRRYGIEFPRSEAGLKGIGADKNAVLYISLDGRATAKLTAAYCVEPFFDMIIERLSKEGIHCVIETYDPMINTSFVAKQRKAGRAPVSVVHKNAADINRIASKAKKRSDHGILAVSSRLKLAEAVVWCARLCKIEKINDIVLYVSLGLGALAVILVSVFAAVPFFMQYLLLFYILAVIGALLFITLGYLPKKNYFSVAELEREDAERSQTLKNRKKDK